MKAAPPLGALQEVLDDALEQALERHLSMAKEWLPHEYVPWHQGRDFATLPYEESQSRLPPAVRAAVQLNLLTEDNLPGYHGELSRLFGRDDPWRTWLDRWTAEEGRHAIVLRDYLTVTRAVDPVQLERDRMATASGGFDASDKTPLRALAYVAFQELATRVSHRGTGRLSGDQGLDDILTRISTDENLHMVLYRDLVAAALAAAPAPTLAAITDEVAGFAMPGTTVPGFLRRAAVVARAGIYDLRVHRDDVVSPLLRYWKVFSLEGLSDQAEQERTRLAAVCDELDRKVAKQSEQLAAKNAALLARAAR
ncbi:MAG: acyl-ACP desaturase [Frankiales bacterium]|nr:acyl-ACP desaturase [Frankiales bacterium]